MCDKDHDKGRCRVLENEIGVLSLFLEGLEGEKIQVVNNTGWKA